MKKRHADILEILDPVEETSVRQLAETLSVSLMTIRRDLALLAHEGRVMRSHGGAMLSQTGSIEFDFGEKSKKRTAEKSTIAREVAKMIEPGMTISLDTGSTTLEVARVISGTVGVTVLTSSLAVASVLYIKENIELILLGGKVRKGIPDLSGPLAEENLARFRVDLAVLGADAVSEDGLFTTDVGISQVSRAMIDGAEKRVLAVDSSKFGNMALIRFADWDCIEHVVTDEGVSKADRKWLKKSVSKVTYAKVT